MIVVDPDPVLRTPCRFATAGEAREVAPMLRAAMQWSADVNRRPAAGLAAPQIGRSLRVFVLVSYPFAFVNPRVVKASTVDEDEREGCLSLPADVLVLVRRPSWVKLTFRDERGAAKTLKLHKRDARAALHEIDHLDGILITDRRAA